MAVKAGRSTVIGGRCARGGGCCRVQRGGGGRCRVQQGDSPRKEAVPEPASPGTVGVGAVLGDAARPPQTSSVLDSLDGGE